MPNYTENYSYAEPQYGEPADIAVLNQYVTRKVDENMYQTRRMMVDGYDSTATYNTGDLVEYSNALYKCLEDNVTGTWDATKWELTTLADSAGGASSLSDLDDVDLTTPADGDILIYDDTDDEWKNAPMPDASVTKSVTGNPVEFTDGADAPLIECKSEIQGSQDLHGYGKPWVGGAGKNQAYDAEYNDITAQYGLVMKASYKLKGGKKYVISFDTPNSDIRIYRAAIDVLGFDSLSLYSVRCNGQRVSMYGYATADADFTGKHLFFRYDETSSIGTGLLSNLQIEEVADDVTTPTAYEPYSNICPITAYTEGEIEVRGKGILTGIEQGAINTVGAKATSSIRVRTKDRLSVKPTTYYLSGTTSESKTLRFSYQLWSSGTWGTNDKLYDSGWAGNDITITVSQNCYLTFVASYTDDSDILPSELSIELLETNAKTTHTTTYPSAIYRGSEDCVNGEVTTEWGMISNYAGETLPGEWISDRDEYVPGTSPTTGAQVAYELATPTTTPVTPTNLPIKSLLGYNHIESSTGEMEVEYITEGYQPLVVSDMTGATASADGTHGLVPAPEAGDEDKFLKGDGTWGEAGGSVAYSTTPKLIGTYNDGTNAYDLYEVTMVTSHSNPNGTNFSYFPDDYSEIISVDGTFSGLIALSSRYYAPMGGWFKQSNDNINVTCSVYFGNFGTGNVRVYYAFHDQSTVTPSGCSCDKQIITVRYTKTANRSLNLSKGEISESEEKTEELPEEGEKAVEKSIEEPVEEPIEEPKEEKEEVTR